MFPTLVLAVLLVTGPPSLRDQQGGRSGGSQVPVFVLHLASDPTHACGLETHLYHLQQQADSFLSISILLLLHTRMLQEIICIIL